MWVSKMPPLRDHHETTHNVGVQNGVGQRGLPYCERFATDPTDSTPDFLETHRWYDEVGRTVGTWGPNAPASKVTYDGLGRVSTSYLTDRRTDAAPGAAGNYAAVSASHAAVLTGDVVFEETSQAYDGSSGLPTLTTHRRRAHDATVSDTDTLASMTSPAPIVTYSAHYYDAALRPIRSVEYGTTHADDILRTGGSAPGYTFGSPPAWYASDTAIITSTEFDAKGRVDSVTAPVTVDPGVEANSVARTTKFVYDLADRRIATIENFDASAPTSIAWSGTSSGGNWDVTGLAAASPDVNRTTTFVYNGVGATVRLSAWNSPDLSAAPSAQVTEYVYGVTTALGVPSELNSNDLLAEVVYPSDSFAPANFHTLYGYNLQGQTIQMAEGQPGAFGTLSSVHAYGYDDDGRLIVDQATSIDSSADGLVDALLYDYDEFGRLERALSQDGYAPPSNGTTVNAVALTYTPLWQVEHVDQNPIGAIGTITSTSATQRVAYAYDTQPSSGGADNHSRASSITYPDGAVENIDYGGGSPGGPDDVTSRLTGLGFGSTKLVAYDHLGFGTVAQVDHPVPDIQLDRVRGHGGGSTSGQYPGFDRFGRVKRQLWVDGGFTAGSGGSPNIPPIVETLYSYDLSGNRLAALDDRPGQAQPLSHGYAYDGLNRLVEAKRGVASGGTVTANKFSQRWRDGSGKVTLDALGNWFESCTDVAGDGYGNETTSDFDRREHDVMNRVVGQILAPGPSSPAPIDLGVGSPPAFEYDYAANLKSHKEWTGSGTSTNTVEYKHDAWNRLVQVKVAGADRSLQGYNALHWRTCKVADVIGSGTGASAGPDGTIEQVRLMYYSADWRLLEERVDDAAASTTTPAKLYDGTWTTSGVDRRQQYLWGNRYIDDIVLHRIDRNADGDYTDTTDGTWYHLTDAQFSSVCLTDRSANVVERVTYSAYGVARHHWMEDVDGDGDVDTSGSSSDRGIVSGIAAQTLANRTIGGSAYRAEADLDRNGLVEVADRNLIPIAIAARPDGQVTDISATGTDNTIAWSGYQFGSESRTYCARHRSFEPALGRWIESDPAGYYEANSLYDFLKCDPISLTDPLGLFTSGNHREITKEALTGVLQGFPYGCITKISESNVDTDSGWMTNSGTFADSRYHGDGCNIEPAIRFMLERARRLRDRCDGKCPGSCYDMIKEIGMLLHTLQDLYSHSDYVERNGGTYKDGHGGTATVGEIPIWELWDEDGNPLVPPRLFSGYYLWPRDRHPTQHRHRDTCKDSCHDIRGKMKNRAGTTNFALARDLSIRHTRAFFAMLYNDYMDPACRYRFRRCCGPVSP
jgi:RHS repeat-associated protein